MENWAENWAKRCIANRWEDRRKTGRKDVLQIDGKIDGKLGRKMYCKIDGKMGGKMDDETGGKVDGKMDSKTDGKIDGNMNINNHKIINPIIPGFYPDPSICRVGGDFYLVNSSFELYPGIPVFHSKDLAHWEQISYAMTMENGFHVNANMGVGGVMAPTIRWHNGIFYIINANFGDKGNFYVSAPDPKGPWSKPHWINDIPDIDCSLFFDDDGSCYLVSPGSDESEDNGRAFFLTPFDIEKGCVRGERKKIWNSAMRKAWAPEAPHIYHIGNYYYLMIAEGGTEHFHSVTIARSETVEGWYEGYKGNPVLTHRHLGKNYPIDNVGHADLIDTPDGRWYAVMLGSRNIDGLHKNMGRETWLCPVEWEDGWPVFSPGTGKVEMEYPADPDLPWTDAAIEPECDDFDSPDLGLHLSFWGVPYQDFWRIADSCLKLKCLSRPMARQLHGFNVNEPDQRRDDCVSFLGRRQRSADFDVEVKMTFSPEGNEAAGLIIMQAANHQIRLEKVRRTGGTALAAQTKALYAGSAETQMLQGGSVETQMPQGGTAAQMLQDVSSHKFSGKYKGYFSEKHDEYFSDKQKGYCSENYNEYFSDKHKGYFSDKHDEYCSEKHNGYNAVEENCVLRLVQVTTWQKGLPFLPGYEAVTTETVLEEREVSAKTLILQLQMRHQQMRFAYGEPGNVLEYFDCKADGGMINPPEIGGMIGTMIGMFATGNGTDSDNEAAFDYFIMKAAE